MADSATPNQLFDLWRKQFEEGAAAWSRMTSPPPPSASDPTAFWRPVLNQGLEQWARLFAQTPVTPDLAAQWKQFLDQWIDAWSRALLTSVAKQIVELEERLERMEDGINAILKRLDTKETT